MHEDPETSSEVFGHCKKPAFSKEDFLFSEEVTNSLNKPLTSAYVQYAGSLAEAINAAFSHEVDSLVSL